MAQQLRPAPRQGVIRYKTCSAKVAAASQEQPENHVTAMVSTLYVDRGDDIILPRAYAGAGLESYKRNPVHLWGHSQEKLHNVIGRAIPDSIDLLEYGVQVTFEYAYPIGVDPKEMTPGQQMAYEACWKYKNGFLSAFSVGVDPLAWVTPDKLDDADRALLQKYDVDPDDAGIIYTLVEWWETSACGVPMNRESLAVRNSWTGFDISDLAGELANLMESRGLRRFGESPWKVCGSRSLDVSDTDTWDKSKAQASLGDDLDDAQVRSTWKKAHVLMEGDGTKKGDYHLPFAQKVDGKMRASKAGLQACAGAHGIDAVDGVPADVRESGRNLIAAYYHKFDPPAKAPWEDKSMPQPPKSAMLAKRHAMKHDVAARLRCAADTVAQDGWPWSYSNDGETKPEDAPSRECIEGVQKILMECHKSLGEMYDPSDEPAPPAAEGPSGSVHTAAAGPSPLGKAGKVLSSNSQEHVKHMMACMAMGMRRGEALMKEAGMDPTDIPEVPSDINPEAGTNDSLNDPENPEEQKTMFRLVP